MAKKSHDTLDDLYFKPMIYGEDMVVIFFAETVFQYDIDAAGKKAKKIKNLVHTYNVSRSVDFDNPVIETLEVVNSENFRAQLSFINPDDHREELSDAATVLMVTINEVTERLQLLSRVFSAFRYIGNNLMNKNKDANLMIGTQTDGLAHIVFNTVTGDTAKLNKEDIDKIGNVIMEVVLSNINTDISNGTSVKKIIDEIEYKIVEALPANSKAGEIHINSESIVEEIKKYQGGNLQEGDNDGEL